MWLLMVSLSFQVGIDGNYYWSTSFCVYSTENRTCGITKSINMLSGDKRISNERFSCLCLFLSWRWLRSTMESLASKQLSMIEKPFESRTYCLISLTISWSWEHLLRMKWCSRETRIFFCGIMESSCWWSYTGFLEAIIWLVFSIKWLVPFSNISTSGQPLSFSCSSLSQSAIIFTKAKTSHRNSRSKNVNTSTSWIRPLY